MDALSMALSTNLDVAAVDGARPTGRAEVLGRMAIERMLAGLSTRRYLPARAGRCARRAGRDEHPYVGGLAPVLWPRPRPRWPAAAGQSVAAGPARSVGGPRWARGGGDRVRRAVGDERSVRGLPGDSPASRCRARPRSRPAHGRRRPVPLTGPSPAGPARQKPLARSTSGRARGAAPRRHTAARTQPAPRRRYPETGVP